MPTSDHVRRGSLRDIVDEAAGHGLAEVHVPASASAILLPSLSMKKRMLAPMKTANPTEISPLINPGMSPARPPATALAFPWIASVVFFAVARSWLISLFDLGDAC